MVSFFDGTNEMGTVTLAATGIATIQLTPINYQLSRGIHELTARYDGNSNFPAATSEVLIQNVIDRPGVTLALSAGRVVQTQPVTLTATVFSGDERIPTGTVTFRVLNGASGRVALAPTIPLDTNGM